jgi:hypothetical protein
VPDLRRGGLAILMTVATRDEAFPVTGQTGNISSSSFGKTDSFFPANISICGRFVTGGD